MKNPKAQRRRQRSPIFAALLLFQLVLLMLQLWLFVSVLEGVLAGSQPKAIPAMIASLACLCVNLWMLIGVEKLDHAK